MDKEQAHKTNPDEYKDYVMARWKDHEAIVNEDGRTVFVRESFPGFPERHLNGNLSIEVEHIKSLLNNLGLSLKEINDLFPTIAQCENNTISISKRLLIYTLRERQIYEDDIYEQFESLILPPHLRF